MVGMGAARTIAVDVRLAMPSWYTGAMSSTTDSELRVLADASLAEAEAIMGQPAVVVGADVSGDGFWEALLARGQTALDKAKKMNPVSLGAKAAGHIRNAARSGASSASDALDDVKKALAALATAAGALAIGPGIILGLLAFLFIESTGYGKRARRAARTYVDRRAREYGF